MFLFDIESFEAASLILPYTIVFWPNPVRLAKNVKIIYILKNFKGSLKAKSI